MGEPTKPFQAKRGQSGEIGMVVAIMRDGGTVDDLSKKQLNIWEGIQRRKAEMEEWEQKHPGVPFNGSTRKRIEELASLEVHENLSYEQIAERLGCSFSVLMRNRKSYYGYYKDRLEAEILTRRQRMQAEIEGAQFTSIRKHIKMVPAADAVYEAVLDPEKMPLTDNNAFAKIAAAKEVRKTVGADMSVVGGVAEVAKLGAIVRDLIGVVRKSRGESAEIDADEVELLPAGGDDDEDEDANGDLSGV